MPTNLTPDSDSERLAEFNPCHGPDDGRFCSTAVTRVGITSYRKRGEPDHRSVGTVLGPDLKRFERDLRAIKSVTHISVAQGTGVFEKGWEPTWIVAYKGNGEARRLIARTAKAYNQDAVLVMHRSSRPKADLDPAVELQFSGGVPHPERKAISDVLRAAGLSGWTWGRRGPNTVLRAVSVPEWGSEAKDHVKRMARVSAALTLFNYTHKVRVKHVETETIGRDDYDRAMGGE